MTKTIEQRLEDLEKKNKMSAATRRGTFTRGMIVFWPFDEKLIPEGWAKCDGTKGTKDLRGYFLVGSGNGVDFNEYIGEETHILEHNVHNLSGHSGATVADHAQHTHTNPNVNDTEVQSGTGDSVVAIVGSTGNGGPTTHTVGQASAHTYDEHDPHTMDNRPPAFAGHWIMYLG